MLLKLAESELFFKMYQALTLTCCCQIYTLQAVIHCHSLVYQPYSLFSISSCLSLVLAFVLFPPLFYNLLFISASFSLQFLHFFASLFLPSHIFFIDLYFASSYSLSFSSLSTLFFIFYFFLSFSCFSLCFVSSAFLQSSIYFCFLFSSISAFLCLSISSFSYFLYPLMPSHSLQFSSSLSFVYA